MPHIYRCRLDLLEATFFSSREVSDLYQTEAFIGHFALAYALGLAPSRYANDGKTTYYQVDCGALNERGIYITPATFRPPVRFTLSAFNAQPDSYWFAMGSNALVTAPDGMWAEQRGQKSWYITDGTNGFKQGAENRPQFGRIRHLGIGNAGEFFVVSDEPLQLPSYIRLGKWMSKARVTAVEAGIVDHVDGGLVPFLLAPADLPATTNLLLFDLLNVAPTPLIRACQLSGPCYRLDDQTLLPQGMRFNLERFP